MKFQEILENNKLVAEFMGDAINLSSYGPNWVAIFKSQGLDGNIPYDKSYDWLMPVVEKIEQTEFLSDVLTFVPVHFNVYINGRSCHITADYNTDKELEKVGTYGITKIDGIYQTVVKFIKWYNVNQNRERNGPLRVFLQK